MHVYHNSVAGLRAAHDIERNSHLVTLCITLYEHHHPYTMSGSPTVIRNVTPNVATFSRPFSRFGVFPIGGRSTAIKLSGDKGVWLLASTPLDDETKTKLTEMGPVK